MVSLMMARIYSITIIVAANVLIPLAALTFVKGFFPHKPFFPGQAQYPDDGKPIPPAPFDKVIFMVVDALRSDFVYSANSGFQFTQSLIRSGAAVPFTAHATSPTITMPRIKAITTGSIPSFLDVILNFAESDTTSSLATQDTWLSQLRSKPGGRLVMFGDDTWLKLFPDTFTRSDGTTSFFVSDYSEVDNNVTRNVPSELSRDDWNGMFLHYLGLDHIGHKAGPNSPNMLPKQIEMDGVVEQIYSAITSKSHLNSTLIVLCGDHGMNEAGNHGGSAPGETSPALLFMAPSLSGFFSGLESPTSARGEFQYYATIEQSDIAPTLSGLLGFPIPLNNLGVFIPDLLKLWQSGGERLQLLYHNGRQIMRIVEAAFPHEDFTSTPSEDDCANPGSDAATLHCGWAKVLDMERSLEDEAIQQSTIIHFLRNAQEIMSGVASDYDTNSLFLGIVISGAAAILAIIVLEMLPLGSLSFPLWMAVCSLAYGLAMFASSFVEEEQHLWYWLCSGWLMWLHLVCYRRHEKSSVLLMISTLTLGFSERIIRRWNQTGQKHAGDPDIGKTFLQKHDVVLWMLIMASYLETMWTLEHPSPKGSHTTARLAVRVLAIGTTLAAFIFKINFAAADSPELLRSFEEYLPGFISETTLITQARAVFLGIVVLGCISVAQYHSENRGIIGKRSSTPMLFAWAWLTWTDLDQSLHGLLTLFLMTQTRVCNIPLFTLFLLQLRAIQYLDLRSEEITITSILFQQAAFFSFGGSNAISSVDLSSAYNGVDSYNVGAVGLLTYVGNWAGPLWWASATRLLLLQHPSDGSLTRHLASLTFFNACHLFFVMLACTVLRSHLFVWTVFSPKYLYSMAWSLGHHLVINICLGGLIFWSDSRSKPR